MNDCIFCKISKGEIPSKKVYEDEHTFAFLDIEPAVEGHTLIIPKRHYKNIYDMPEDELKAVISTAKKIANIYKEKLGIDSLNLVQSNNASAQQDVFHFHMHVLPRTQDDGVDIWGKTHKRSEKKLDVDSFFERLK